MPAQMNRITGIYYSYYLLVLIVLAAPGQLAQDNQAITGWKTTNYPDPRTDFAKCGQSDPGFLCDPDGLLTNQERIALSAHATETGQNAKKVVNTSPYCRNGTPDGLPFYFVLMNKINADGQVVGRAEAKQFAYEIKAKYNIVNNVDVCDTTILILCSMKDGQLYMVAGRDTLLTGDALDEAFDRNRFRFTAGNIFGGLTDLLTQLAASYSTAHNSLIDPVNSSVSTAPADPFLLTSTASAAENGSINMTSQTGAITNTTSTEVENEPLSGDTEPKQAKETADYFDALASMNHQESTKEPFIALDQNADDFAARSVREGAIS